MALSIYYLAWVLTLATAVVDSSALAAPTIRTACNAYDGDLDPSTQGVLYDDPHFDFDGKTFPLQVFSLANPAPWSTNFICLRYELENVGNDPIPLVFWEFIQEWSAFDLPPRERLARTQRRPSTTKVAVEGPTVIKAFRSEEILTTAWQTIEDYQKKSKKAAMSEPNRQLRFVRSAELDAAAARAIENREIPDVEVAVLEPGGDPLGLPPAVGDVLIAPFGEIRTSSSVFLPPPRSFVPPLILGVNTSLVIQRKPGIEFQAYAPALVAMGNPAVKTTTSFLQVLKDSKGPIKSLAEKGDFYVASDGDSRRVFVVEHPITVNWTGPDGSGSTCIKAAMYSLYPVSVGREYCAR